MVVTVNYAESIQNSDEKSFIQDQQQTYNVQLLNFNNTLNTTTQNSQLLNTQQHNYTQDIQEKINESLEVPPIQLNQLQ